MIAQVEHEKLPTILDDLTTLLHGCVHNGASIGFVLPFDIPQAQAYWSDRVFPTIRENDVILFVARDKGKVVGTVQLALAAMPNQPHRADVAKLLVHPDARRRGFGRALMLALETHAKSAGRTLLTLDTRSSDPSLQLYLSLGFEIAGEIPGYCRNPFADRYEPTTYMYKRLE